MRAPLPLQHAHAAFAVGECLRGAIMPLAAIQFHEVQDWGQRWHDAIGQTESKIHPECPHPSLNYILRLAGNGLVDTAALSRVEKLKVEGLLDERPAFNLVKDVVQRDILSPQM